MLSSVFVTGATGFIGQHLLRELLASGSNVSALVLPGEIPLVPAGVHIYVGDITQAGAITQALRAAQPEAVIHLAGVGQANPGISFTEALRINVAGTIHLLEAARDTGNCTRLVLVGSSHEYGARRNHNGVDPFNAYSASKVAAWAFGRAAYNSWGAPVVWLRPFQVYGPGQRAQALIPAAIHAALTGRDFPMTAGEQQRDFIFVSDVVAGILRAAVAPGIEGRTFDLGAGQLHRVGDVVQQIWTLTGARGHILLGTLPYRAGEVAAIPADVAHSQRLIGWRASVSLEEGLKHTIASIRETQTEFME
ncbi:MAG: NAD(P)-dependent oxidoreductase [Anaerolineae bacterium]|nr:NAD(P)-dependent oxidoreductase [Anaerolineae bacterium]